MPYPKLSATVFRILGSAMRNKTWFYTPVVSAPVIKSSHIKSYRGVRMIGCQVRTDRKASMKPVEVYKLYKIHTNSHYVHLCNYGLAKQVVEVLTRSQNKPHSSWSLYVEHDDHFYLLNNLQVTVKKHIVSQQEANLQSCVDQEDEAGIMSFFRIVLPTPVEKSSSCGRWWWRHRAGYLPLEGK